MPLFRKKSFAMQPIMPSIEARFPVNTEWLPVEGVIVKSMLGSVKSLSAIVPPVAESSSRTLTAMAEFSFLYTHVADRFARRLLNGDTYSQFSDYLWTRSNGVLVDSVVTGGTAPTEREAANHASELFEVIQADSAARRKRYEVCTERVMGVSAPLTDDSLIGCLAGQLATSLQVVEDDDAWRQLVRQIVDTHFSWFELGIQFQPLTDA